MRVLNGYTRTTEDPSVRNRVQVKGGADEQPAGRPDQGRRRVAVRSSVHALALAQQVRDGELVGRSAPLDAGSVAELQRLREVEQQFKRLQMEHDLLKKAIRFASERKRKSLRSSRQSGARTRSK